MASAKKTSSENTSSKKNVGQTIWEYVKSFFSFLWSIIVFLAHWFIKLLVGIYLLIKSIAFSLSALIASIALMIIAVSLSVYLISLGMGLKDSPNFGEWRDEMIQQHRLYYEAHQRDWMMKEPRAAEDYTVAEVTEQACTTDADCIVPMDYAVRSVCPYMSRCIENKCTVVCPRPFNHLGQ